MRILSSKSAATRVATGLRNKLRLSATVIALAAGLYSTIGATALTPGDIYVYTSPGVIVDVTQTYPEWPVVTINGVQTQIFADTKSGNVYDSSGNTVGFIY